MRVGDPDFDRAVDLSINVLRDLARQARRFEDALITYRQLSERLAVDGLLVPYHQGPLPHILEHASRREHAEGRGLISALVVQQGFDGRPSMPSGGFFAMARRAPYKRSGSNEAIWMTEVQRVIDECAERS